MSYYQRFKDIREDKDHRQKDTAELLNITRQQYGLYENGTREMPFSKIIEFANFYNVSLDYIAGRSKDKRGMSKTDLPKDEAELVRMYRELSDLRKGEIIGTIKTLYRQQIEESADERGAV
ncbi:MAG: helix-turn-helix transcriptional regulator [Oscillospiraceae bacterium]|nr:helix-turn-helix transcriptional regulator [Oscillospiraceae bacterium]